MQKKPARLTALACALAIIAARAAFAQEPVPSTPVEVEAPGRTPAPPEARVYVSYPKDGATVTSPFLVRFALSGMGVAPAGVERPSTGHHHLLIDVEEPPAPDKFIPADDYHIHFGGGQTETRLTLPAGKHTLQLLLGDKNHIPHDPVVISKVITITVQDPLPTSAPDKIESPAEPTEKEVPAGPGIDPPSPN